jgi:hypothetical protein
VRLLLLTRVVAVPAALAADNPDPKDKRAPRPREIKVKSLTGGKGQLDKPEKIGGKDDLEKTIASKEVRAEIAKQVDFKKEYLLLFRWGGSGQDKLTIDVEKGKKGDLAVITYKRGLTRDYRRHVRLFAIPKGMEYKLKR